MNHSVKNPPSSVRAPSASVDLLDALGIDAVDSNISPLSKQEAIDFPLRVTPEFTSRMQRGDPNDPLLRQVLPVSAETEIHKGFRDDPVGDLQSVVSTGMLQKYHGRALLILTGACAIHCRYCFRRTYPYSDGSVTRRELEQTLRQIKSDTTLEEIILSGGDPLMLSNTKLNKVLSELGNIEHLKRIRIHTRIPVVSPGRIDTSLIQALKQCKKPIVVVIHCNHAAEIDDEAGQALIVLGQCTEHLLNQSVLLRGVNDSADALTDLSNALFKYGVLPYYIHQLDQVTGTAHFKVDDHKALQLIKQTAEKLPGYLVPKLVRETAGEKSKRPL
ncbi:MAG: EF-P beta-lysylation protein EpmB [Gammaproteobacteria bacterium]|nr:EF-P beta-lysylation protein EpmB [Gammaproteobacteria bacterium]